MVDFCRLGHVSIYMLMVGKFDVHIPYLLAMATVKLILKNVATVQWRSLIEDDVYFI